MRGIQRLCATFSAAVSLSVSARAQQSAGSPPLAVEEIMRQVAAHQELAQQERRQYLYRQRVQMTVRRTNGKLTCQEITDWQVTPGVEKSTKNQLSVAVSYWKKGVYHALQGPADADAQGLDCELARDLRSDLTNDDSKDGLAKHLFPLTREEQQKLTFTLQGEQLVSARPAYRVRFEPVDRNDLAWTGEALIDKQELQPVSVYTRLSRRFPLFVRTMLGTDLPGLGFSVRYQRLAPDLWFPVTFGTEFRLRAVFFINRNISLSLENSHFQRTTAESSIRYTAP